MAAFLPKYIIFFDANDKSHYARTVDDGSVKWNDQSYRTVHFQESPTGALLEWLQQNAVKQ